MKNLCLVLMLATLGCKKETVDGAVSELASVKEKACACKDAACFDKVEKDAASSMKLLGDKKLSDAQAKRVAELVDAIDKCSSSVRSGPEHVLQSIGKDLKVSYAMDKKLPAGKAGPSPAGNCCQGPDKKCAAWKGWTADPVWGELMFTLDEPSAFNYSYESDGKTATVTAVGDPECDGKTATYKLVATPSGESLDVKITGP